MLTTTEKTQHNELVMPNVPGDFAAHLGTSAAAATSAGVTVSMVCKSNGWQECV